MSTFARGIVSLIVRRIPYFERICDYKFIITVFSIEYIVNNLRTRIRMDVNNLEIQKKIAKDLIDIIRLDKRIFSEDKTIEILAIVFLLLHKDDNREFFHKNAEESFIHSVEYKIREINPRIWEILGLTFREMNIDTLSNIQSYLNSYALVIEQITLPQIFEEILYEQARDFSKYRGEFIQPIEVTNFIYQLADIDKKAYVYNPFAGMASYGVEIGKKYHYVGQEINETTWAIGWIRLFLNNSYCFDYIQEDSIINWKHEQFDLIVSTPPFGRIHNNILKSRSINSFEEFLLIEGVRSLKIGGRIICLLSEGFFFSDDKSQKLLRKELLLKGYVEMVISLPSNILYNTSIKTSILVLNNNRRSDEISFVNGSGFYANDKGQNRLQYQHLIKEIRENNSKYIRHVSTSEVKNNDYRLDVYGYFIEKIIIPDGYTKFKLKDILTYNNQRTSLNEEKFVLSISDLKESPFDSPITYMRHESNKKNIVNKSVYYSNQDILLVSPRFKTLKPTFYKTDNSPIFYSSNIAGFYLKENVSIDLNYLIYELNADYIKNQVEAFSIGTVMTYMRIKDFLEIEILFPRSLDSQKLIVTRAKEVYEANKIKELGLENYIKKENEKFRQILNIKTHRIRPFLSGLADNVDLLIGEFQEKGVVKYNEIIVNTYSIKDLLENMKECLIDVKGIFKELTNDLNVGKKEIFDIKNFIEKYTFNHKTQKVLFEIKKEFDHKSFLLKSNERISTNISFNRNNLKEIIDLVIENAERHGFSKKQKSTNEIVIRVVYPPDSDDILLSIKNNGQPMHMDFTEEHFFANGIFSGETGNTGIGGFRIKEIIEKLGGKVHLINNPQSKYPVEIQIYLPISF